APGVGLATGRPGGFRHDPPPSSTASAGTPVGRPPGRAKGSRAASAEAPGAQTAAYPQVSPEPGRPASRTRRRLSAGHWQGRNEVRTGRGAGAEGETGVRHGLDEPG